MLGLSLQFQARLLDSVFRGPGHGTLSAQPRGSFYKREHVTVLFLQLVQSLSAVWLCDPVNCSMPGLPVHHQPQSLLRFMSIESVMPSNHLILCCPLLLLPSIFPSIRVFSTESVLHIRWPKYWSFSFSIGPSKEYSGLICFRIDWFELLAIQGTLKSSSTPQFKSINSSVPSFLYGPTLTSMDDYWKSHNWLDGPLLAK